MLLFLCCSISMLYYFYVFRFFACLGFSFFLCVFFVLFLFWFCSVLFFLPELCVYSLGIHLSELFKMGKGTCQDLC